LKPVEQLSLGWRTHLIFPRFDAIVTERADYLLVRTPHNPTYFWGNFLLFDRPPRVGEAASWLTLFAAEISALQPESSHLAFGIDAKVRRDEVLLPEFEALGLHVDAGTVLTLRPEQLRAPRKPLPPEFDVRPLRLPEEAPLAVDAQVNSDAGFFEPAGYRVFRERQMTRYAAMAGAGLGLWFGVFRDGLVLADCGLFTDAGREPASGATLGRFQHVSTHPAWRRRGLCSALIHAACRHGFEVLGLRNLVIVADPDDVAIGLYESLGFERGETKWHLERRPLPG